MEIENLFLDAGTVRVFEMVEDMGINIIDKNGRFICFSTGSELLDKMKRCDVIGKHVLEVYRFYNDAVSPALKVLTNGQPIKDYNIRYMNKDGLPIDAVSSVYPILSPSGEESLGSMCIYRDKSNLMMLTKRLEQLEAKLRLQENRKNGTRYHFSDIVGVSDAIKDCIQHAELAAGISSPVLVLGETGTGKELFAQSIHNASRREAAPFVAINCSAIPDNLLESTLFGTVKGAFTGATDMEGLFEAAQNGTVFLDEINSMNLMLQSKILRILETGAYRRVGSTKEQYTKAQIISAMNQSPTKAIEAGLIRTDLYYRLGAFTITLPPLKKRREDILPLALSFLSTESTTMGKALYDFSEEARYCLYHYDWPGNIRELKHVVLHAVLMSTYNDQIITPKHLPAALVKNINSKMPSITTSDHQPSLKKMTEDFQRKIILQTLNTYSYNITKSANALGLARQNLQYHIRTLNIQTPYNSGDKRE